jgi:hypothetical protein
MTAADDSILDASLKILAERKCIAILWSTEDVQSVRPDLDEEQAWEVLQACKRHHDACVGINWDVLECVAASLVPLKLE